MKRLRIFRGDKLFLLALLLLETSCTIDSLQSPHCPIRLLVVGEDGYPVEVEMHKNGSKHVFVPVDSQERDNTGKSRPVIEDPDDPLARLIIQSALPIGSLNMEPDENPEQKKATETNIDTPELKGPNSPEKCFNQTPLKQKGRTFNTDPHLENSNRLLNEAGSDFSKDIGSPKEDEEFHLHPENFNGPSFPQSKANSKHTFGGTVEQKRSDEITNNTRKKEEPLPHDSLKRDNYTIKITTQRTADLSETTTQKQHQQARNMQGGALKTFPITKRNYSNTVLGRYLEILDRIGWNKYNYSKGLSENAPRNNIQSSSDISQEKNNHESNIWGSAFTENKAHNTLRKEETGFELIQRNSNQDWKQSPNNDFKPTGKSIVSNKGHDSPGLTKVSDSIQGEINVNTSLISHNQYDTSLPRYHGNSDREQLNSNRNREIESPNSRRNTMASIPLQTSDSSGTIENQVKMHSRPMYDSSYYDNMSGNVNLRTYPTISNKNPNLEREPRFQDGIEPSKSNSAISNPQDGPESGPNENRENQHPPQRGIDSSFHEKNSGSLNVRSYQTISNTKTYLENESRFQNGVRSDSIDSGVKKSLDTSESGRKENQENRENQHPPQSGIDSSFHEKNSGSLNVRSYQTISNTKTYLEKDSRFQNGVRSDSIDSGVKKSLDTSESGHKENQENQHVPKHGLESSFPEQNSGRVNVRTYQAISETNPSYSTISKTQDTYGPDENRDEIHSRFQNFNNPSMINPDRSDGTTLGTYQAIFKRKQLQINHNTGTEHNFQNGLISDMNLITTKPQDSPGYAKDANNTPFHSHHLSNPWQRDATATDTTLKTSGNMEISSYADRGHNFPEDIQTNMDSNISENPSSSRQETLNSDQNFNASPLRNPKDSAVNLRGYETKSNMMQTPSSSGNIDGPASIHSQDLDPVSITSDRKFNIRANKKNYNKMQLNPNSNGESGIQYSISREEESNISKASSSSGIMKDQYSMLANSHSFSNPSMTDPKAAGVTMRKYQPISDRMQMNSHPDENPRFQNGLRSDKESTFSKTSDSFGPKQHQYNMQFSQYSRNPSFNEIKSETTTITTYPNDSGDVNNNKYNEQQKPSQSGFREKINSNILKTYNSPVFQKSNNIQPEQSYKEVNPNKYNLRDSQINSDQSQISTNQGNENGSPGVQKTNVESSRLSNGYSPVDNFQKSNYTSLSEGRNDMESGVAKANTKDLLNEDMQPDKTHQDDTALRRYDIHENVKMNPNQHVNFFPQNTRRDDVNVYPIVSKISDSSKVIKESSSLSPSLLNESSASIDSKFESISSRQYQPPSEKVNSNSIQNADTQPIMIADVTPATPSTFNSIGVSQDSNNRKAEHYNYDPLLRDSNPNDATLRRYQTISERLSQQPRQNNEELSSHSTLRNDNTETIPTTRDYLNSQVIQEENNKKQLPNFSVSLNTELKLEDSTLGQEKTISERMRTNSNNREATTSPLKEYMTSTRSPISETLDSTIRIEKGNNRKSKLFDSYSFSQGNPNNPIQPLYETSTERMLINHYHDKEIVLPSILQITPKNYQTTPSPTEIIHMEDESVKTRPISSTSSKPSIDEDSLATSISTMSSEKENMSPGSESRPPNALSEDLVVSSQGIPHSPKIVHQSNRMRPWRPKQGQRKSNKFRKPNSRSSTRPMSPSVLRGRSNVKISKRKDLNNFNPRFMKVTNSMIVLVHGKPVNITFIQDSSPSVGERRESESRFGAKSGLKPQKSKLSYLNMEPVENAP